jgi:hypothetical protein
MNVEIKKVSLKDIKLNPDNPRTITGKDMDLLVKSLQSFPEMMELREIVVDETMTVLGGNMRTLALQKIGAADCLAKIVTGLTDEQKREFIVKDNGGFGQWNMDELANSWSDLPLDKWGVALPEDFFKVADDIEILEPEYGDSKDNKILCSMKNNITKEFMDFVRVFEKKYKGLFKFTNMSGTPIGE